MGPVCLYTSKQFNCEQNTKIILLSRDKIANFIFHILKTFALHWQILFGPRFPRNSSTTHTYITIFTKIGFEYTADGATTRYKIIHQRKNFLVCPISAAMQSLLLDHLVAEQVETVDGDAEVQRLDEDHRSVEVGKGQHHRPGLGQVLAAGSRQ